MLFASLVAQQPRLRTVGQSVSRMTVCLCITALGVNVRFCRDEVCRITVYQAGWPRLRLRTSEPRDRAWWTLAASVPQADIDYGTWSSRRGNPHAYPPDLGGIGGSLLNGVAAQIGSIWRGRDVFRAAGIADLD